MTIVNLYLEMNTGLKLGVNSKNTLKDKFIISADENYTPGINFLINLIKNYPGFRIALGISDLVLEQAEKYRPKLITLLQELYDVGTLRNQLELIDMPQHNSLSSLFKNKAEFIESISLYRSTRRAIFGDIPVSAFRNTGGIFDKDIAAAVSEMGYKATLVDLPKRDERAYSGRILKADNLVVLPIDWKTSNLLSNILQSPQDLEKALSNQEREVVTLAYNFDRFDNDHKKGRFDLIKNIENLSDEKFLLMSPSETATAFEDKDLEQIRIPHLYHLEDIAKATRGKLSNRTQYILLRRLETLRDKIGLNQDLLDTWRMLNNSDRLYPISTGTKPSVAKTTYDLTTEVIDLEHRVRHFDIWKKSERTKILLVSPETGPLPKEMGPLAQYITGKSGGLGEVISALAEGLIQRGHDVHLATLNLKKRFMQESDMSEQEWRNIRDTTPPGNIHLVTSHLFADNKSAYGGNPMATAVEFQSQVINNIIKYLRPTSNDNLLIHSHDWMSGGMISAYARARGIPLLHTLHNSFTSEIPIKQYENRVDFDELREYLFLNHDKIDCQATATKSAWCANTVSSGFLSEMVNDHFADIPVIPTSVRQEIKAKYNVGSALSVLNCPSTALYPENTSFLSDPAKYFDTSEVMKNHQPNEISALIKKFGPDDDIVSVKKNIRLAFQRIMGLNENPDAILLYWPSRLDPWQKGVEILESIAFNFVQKYPDVQIAVVADGNAGDRYHEDVLGQISVASGGKIAYQHFSDHLSILGYAAASDVFGVSRYEPCGQIDQVANLFGATATNRKTGGYSDKIKPLQLKALGATSDEGNGILFRDYDSVGLWYGLESSAKIHRYMIKHPKLHQQQLKRIMLEAREKWNLDNMVAGYLSIYERLKGRPLK